MSGRMAATKDSGSRNSRGGGRRYHVLSKGSAARCGEWPCCDDMASPAEDVPEILRCRRRGCAEDWPEKGGDK